MSVGGFLLRTSERRGGLLVRATGRLLAVILGIVGCAVAVEQFVERRAVDRRYQQAVRSRDELERQFNRVVATHTELTEALERSRQRATELAETLERKNAQLDETLARLAAESRTTQQLQTRLIALEHQMEQIQGELALALAKRPPASGESSASKPVELERVVVGESASMALQGRVISVSPDWNFVIVDLGWDHVQIGDQVSIYRNDQLLAKGRVERVQERAAAVTLLPDWQSAEVRVNDLVKLL